MSDDETRMMSRRSLTLGIVAALPGAAAAECAEAGLADPVFAPIEAFRRADRDWKAASVRADDLVELFRTSPFVSVEEFAAAEEESAACWTRRHAAVDLVYGTPPSSMTGLLALVDLLIDEDGASVESERVGAALRTIRASMEALTPEARA